VRRRTLLAGLPWWVGAAAAQPLTQGATVPACFDHQRCYSGSNVPPGASLDLSFMTPGSLDPRVVFTRAAGPATYFDAGGVLRTAAVNLLLYSGDLSNAAWGVTYVGAASPIVTGNQAAAPNGTMTAARVAYPAVSGAGNYSAVYQGPLALQAATYTFSIWARGNIGGEVIWLYNGLTNGQPMSLTTSWQRFTQTVSNPTAGNVYLEIGIDLRDGTETAKPAQTVFLWGGQVEQGSAASPYIPTTSAPNGAPRWDYDPVTHALKGVLIEEARTNLVLQSGDLSNAAWQPSGLVPVVTGNQATAPDGTMTAARIAYPAVSGAGSFSHLAQQIALSAGTYSLSVWLRGSVGGEQLYLMTVTGSGYASTLVTLTTSWQRFVLVTPAEAAGASYYQLGTDLRDATQTAKPAQTIFAWGVQEELGAFATSYIGTTAAPVTRAADVATIPVGAWFNATAYSVVAEAMVPMPPPLGIVFSVCDAGGSNNRLQVAIATSEAVQTTLSSGGVNSVVNQEPFFATNGVPFKFGSSLQAGNYMSSFNGVTPYQSTTGIVMPVGVTEIALGYFPGGNILQLDGYMRHVRYWPRVLSATELQSVTR
jgi:hypothetical protein